MLDTWYLRGGQGADKVKTCSVLDLLSCDLVITKVFGESPYIGLITDFPISPSYADGTQVYTGSVQLIINT